jgi:hypothetical protein
LSEYQSFGFQPRLTPDDVSQLIAALKSADIRFTYAPDTDHRPGLLLMLHAFCPAGREVLARVLPTHTVHEGDYQALIPLDELPSVIHNRLCDMDYGEVQHWQTPLQPAQLPPLGNLLSKQDQHAWLVPRKFTAWLKEDLIEQGWRTVDDAGAAADKDKVLVTGEWVSVRLLAGKPSPEVHAMLISGRFGKVVRLGDAMPRPTSLNYDLSMLMKDVYMIPKEHEEEVLTYLEPEALLRKADEQELQRQVDELKKRNKASNLQEDMQQVQQEEKQRRRADALQVLNPAQASMQQTQALGREKMAEEREEEQKMRPREAERVQARAEPAKREESGTQVRVRAETEEQQRQRDVC